MRVENTITIDAPADVVWDLTMDVTRWPAMTSTVQRVERLDAGPLQVGSAARIKQPGQPSAVWTVTKLVANRQFVWRTTRLGLTMTGSHLLEDLGDGCRNTLTLDVAGRGARLFGMIFGGRLRKALETENAGFKATAQRHG
jgi:uncharacterized membrane protein